MRFTFEPARPDGFGETEIAERIRADVARRPLYGIDGWSRAPELIGWDLERDSFRALRYVVDDGAFAEVSSVVGPASGYMWTEILRRARRDEGLERPSRDSGRVELQVDGAPRAFVSSGHRNDVWAAEDVLGIVIRAHGVVLRDLAPTSRTDIEAILIERSRFAATRSSGR
jgi:hypothetical protein